MASTSGQQSLDEKIALLQQVFCCVPIQTIREVFEDSGGDIDEASSHLIPFLHASGNNLYLDIKDEEGQEKDSVHSSVEKRQSFDQNPVSRSETVFKLANTVGTPEALATTEITSDYELPELFFVREIGVSSTTNKHSSNIPDLANIHSKMILEDLAEVSKDEHHQDSDSCKKNHMRVFSTNKTFSRFIIEHQEHEIREIEKQRSQGEDGISITFCPEEPDFIISGDNEETVDQVYEQLRALKSRIVSQQFETYQPGVRKFFAEGGEGRRRLESIEKDYTCVVEIELVNQVPGTEKMGEKDQTSNLPEIPAWQNSIAARKDQDTSGSDSVLVTPEGIRISWKVGNIATEQVDVLVNSVRSDLDLSRGAISKALSKAAGPELQRECVKITNYLDLDDMIVTPPGNLPCKHVVHVVCTSWDGGMSGRSEETLSNLVGNCLWEASQLHACSVAFPAIGTGKLNFPPEMVARIFMEEALEFSSCSGQDTSITDIRFIVYNQDYLTRDAFAKEMGAAKTYFQASRKAPPTKSPTLNSKRKKRKKDKERTSSGIKFKCSSKAHPCSSRSRELDISTSNTENLFDFTTASFFQSSAKTWSWKNTTGKNKTLVKSPEKRKSNFLAPKQPIVENGSGTDPVIKKSSQAQCKTISKFKIENVTVKVVESDVVEEPIDGVVCVNDVNMNFIGSTSIALGEAGGPEIKQVCARLTPRPFGSVVMSSPGYLPAKYIIHIVPEAELSKFQDCLVEALQLSDSVGMKSVLIPILESYPTPTDVSIDAVMHYLQKEPVNVREVTVFQVTAPSIKQEVSNSFTEHVSNTAVVECKAESARDGAKFFICGEEEIRVSEAKNALKMVLSEACIEDQLTNDIVQRLDSEEKALLFNKAKELDVRVEIKGSQALVSGLPTDVAAMLSEVLKLVNKRLEKEVRAHAQLVSKNVQWQYTRHGIVHVFEEQVNAVIEKAYSDRQENMSAYINEEKVTIDFKGMTYSCNVGHGSVERVSCRDIQGYSINLPAHWDRQPYDPVTRKQRTLHCITLDQWSDEYQQLYKQFYDTGGTGKIVKIERLQNPHLYRAYMLRKEKMNADNGSTENELRLFHGTNSKNVKAISTQGFNRSYCGTHGTTYGKGVYFALNAEYSLRYATTSSFKRQRLSYESYESHETKGVKYMFVAHVLVGMYTAGQSGMVAPPPKDGSRPEILYDSVVDSVRRPTIYVVFHDTQCYPAYLITF